jgi:hypothetical protein
MVGCLKVELKLFGPVHSYRALGEKDAVKLIVLPAQIGVATVAAGETLQVPILIGVAVDPEIAQPFPSKIPGLLLLLNSLPDTFPVPIIFALLLITLSHAR